MLKIACLLDTCHSQTPARRRLADYSSCIQLCQDIVELINDRNTDARAGANVSPITMLIKKDLLNLKGMVEKLKVDLFNYARANTATHGEVERRQNLLDTLATRVRILIEAADSGRHISTSEIHISERYELLSTESAPRPSSSNEWLESDERIAALSAEQFRFRRDEVIRDQNEGLDRLSKSLKRQKKIGINIGNEADNQRVLIDDIHTQMDASNERMQAQTESIVAARKKSATGTWILWTIVALLLIAIVVVAVT